MQMRLVRPLALVTLLLAAGVAPALAQQGPPPGGGGGGGRPMMGPPLQLTSTAFGDGTMIPDKYTCVAAMGMAGEWAVWIHLR